MKTIQSYINELKPYELAQAVEEIEQWEKKSVLCEGIVKKVSEKLNKAFHLDSAHSRRLVKEGVIARAALEYAKIMKWKPNSLCEICKQHLKKRDRYTLCTEPKCPENQNRWKQEKMCPYGKEAQAQCTPLRAQDCAHSDACGKTKRRRK